MLCGKLIKPNRYWLQAGFWDGRAFGDAHKIITFYSFISLTCLALAIFSPRFTEILTDGCETPSFLDNSVVLKPGFLTAQ